ncbi:MAG: hypothetical protein Q8L95_05530 [Burkholderiales bacterium]|nr:hypothetical protein [Burkholderiales bacterium]
MKKPRLLLWALIAWPLPALIAAALGWKGVWGSGSALLDYLIPVPVAGGVLHVPSFVVAGVVVLLLPGLDAAGAARLRALLIGGALAGALWLLNLHDLWLAQQTGMKFSGRLWQENPLGLFLVCDAVLALVFTAGAAQGPRLRLDVLTLILILLPSALPLSMAKPRAAADPPFRAGMSQHGETRGDESLMVFTRLDTQAADFRAQAEAWAEQPASMAHPRFHVSAEDMAVMFTRNREAAQRLNRDQVMATLCLYEDGAPPRWLPGAGDCFSGHQGFSERLARAAGARPQDEPAELRAYLAARELCAQEKFASGEAGQGLQLTSAFICEGLSRRGRELLQKFPDAPQLQEPAR